MRELIPVAWIACLLVAIPASLRGAEEDVAALIEKLRGTDAEARVHAAEQLGQLGPAAKPAVPDLIKALDGDDQAMTYEAVTALGRIGPGAAEALPALRRMMADKAHKILLRHAAIEALPMLGPAAQAAIPDLKTLLKAKAPLISSTAASALMRLDPESVQHLEPILRELIQGLSAKNAAVRSASVQSLSELGVQAVPSLTKALETPAEDVVSLRNACDALAGIGHAAKPAVPGLLKLVDASQDVVKVHAMQALGNIGEEADTVVPKLAAALTDRHPRVRMHAARSLGQFGARAKPAVAPLGSALTDKVERVRLASAQALGQIGPDAAAAVPALAKALDDEAGTVTLSAAEALGKIGAAAAPAVAERLSNPKMRALAAGVLGDLGPQARAAVPALIKALQVPDSEGKQEIMLALGAIGSEARPAVPELLKTLKAEGDPTRAAAAFALAGIGATEAGPLLKQTVTSKDEVLALASARALLRLGPDNPEHVSLALPRLIAALSQKSAGIRREAAEALADLGPRAGSAVPALIKALHDEDADVRLAVLAALEEIGAGSKAAVSDLTRLLSDHAPEVRTGAAYALGKLGPDAKPAVPDLQRLLASKDEVEQTVAGYALVRIAPSPMLIQTAVPLLIRALNDETSNLRVEAATLLGQIGGGRADAKSALQKASTDPDDAVRKAAVDAAKELGR